MSSLIKGKKVGFTDTHLLVELEDERIIMTPLSWYPDLQDKTLKELSNYKFICMGTGIEWPEFDLQLSVESMLNGLGLETQVA